MQKSLLPLSITSPSTEALAAHHPSEVTQAAGVSACGILVTLKPGSQFAQSHQTPTPVLFYSGYEHTLNFYMVWYSIKGHSKRRRPPAQQHATAGTTAGHNSGSENSCSE